MKTLPLSRDMSHLVVLGQNDRFRYCVEATGTPSQVTSGQQKNIIVSIPTFLLTQLRTAAALLPSQSHWLLSHESVSGVLNTGDDDRGPLRFQHEVSVPHDLWRHHLLNVPDIAISR